MAVAALALGEMGAELHDVGALDADGAVEADRESRKQYHVGRVLARVLGERVALGDVDAGREVDGQGDDDAPRRTG